MSEFDVQQILLTITGVAATLFPVIYTLIAPWWKSMIGRALVLSDISLALLVDIALLAYWFHWVISTHVTTAILVLIAAAAVMRCLAIINIQVSAWRAKSNTPVDDTLLDAPGSQM